MKNKFLLFLLMLLVLLSSCNNIPSKTTSTTPDRNVEQTSNDSNTLLHPIYIDNVIEIKENSTLNLSFLVQEEYADTKYTLELYNVTTGDTIPIFSQKVSSKKIETSVTIPESGEYLLCIVSKYASIPETAYEINYFLQEPADTEENVLQFLSD